MTTLSDYLDTAKQEDTYWIEDAKSGFAVEIERHMEVHVEAAMVHGFDGEREFAGVSGT